MNAQNNTLERDKFSKSESTFSMPNLPVKNMNLSFTKNSINFNHTIESKESSNKTHYLSESSFSKQNKKKITTQIQDNSFENLSKLSQMITHKELNYYQIKDKSK